MRTSDQLRLIGLTKFDICRCGNSANNWHYLLNTLFIICLVFYSSIPCFGDSPSTQDGPQKEAISSIELLIAQGDSTAMGQMLVDKRLKPNDQLDGIPYLYEAVILRRVEVVRQLLKAGANPNQKIDKTGDPSDGATPLFASVQNHSDELTAMLLKAGADPKLASKSGITPIQLAEIFKYQSQSELMRIPTSQPDSSQLIWLVTSGNDGDAMKAIRSVSAGNIDKKATTVAAHLAAASGNIKVLRALLDAGVDVNALDESGATLLVVAVATDQEEVARLLLEKGADPAIMDDCKDTAYSVAADSKIPGIRNMFAKLKK